MNSSEVTPITRDVMNSWTKEEWEAFYKQSDLNQLDAYLEDMKYPPILEKACRDPHVYAAYLKDHTTILFSKATPIDKDWVHLTVDEITNPNLPFQINTNRGIDIRLDTICFLVESPIKG